MKDITWYINYYYISGKKIITFLIKKYQTVLREILLFFIFIDIEFINLLINNILRTMITFFLLHHLFLRFFNVIYEIIVFFTKLIVF